MNAEFAPISGAGKSREIDYCATLFHRRSALLIAS